jgi:hypothetical protein
MTFMFVPVLLLIPVPAPAPFRTQPVIRELAAGMAETRIPSVAGALIEQSETMSVEAAPRR